MDLGLAGRGATEVRGRFLIAGLLRTAVGSALTSMAHARAREGRGGADRRALGSPRLAPAFSFLISLLG